MNNKKWKNARVSVWSAANENYCNQIAQQNKSQRYSAFKKLFRGISWCSSSCFYGLIIGGLTSGLVLATVTTLWLKSSHIQSSTSTTTTIPVCFNEPTSRPSNSWYLVGNMSSARYAHTATLLSQDNSVFLAGGSNSVILASTERYLPLTGCFQSTGNMSNSRMLHTADQLSVSSGSVLLAGGATSPYSTSTNSADLYNPFTGNKTSINMTVGRRWHRSMLWNQTHLLLVGGIEVNTLNTTDELNMNSLLFSTNFNKTLNIPRHYHTATRLGSSSNLFLIVGGMNIWTPLASIELYDGSSGMFTLYPTNMAGPRFYHTATYIPSPINQVLIAGGNSGWVALNTFSVFDIATMSLISVTNTMLSIRMYHTATLLPNEKVLLIGGSNGTAALSTCELIDPVNSYSSTLVASLQIARYQHTATLIPNNGNWNILVCGGNSSSFGILSSCELYYT